MKPYIRYVKAKPSAPAAAVLAPPVAPPVAHDVERDEQALTPFLRWVGGKNWLAPRLVDLISTTNAIAYHEPFLGGGAVLLRMAARMPVRGYDLNKQLVNCWQWVLTEPDQLHAALMRIVATQGADAEGYLKVRAQFNVGTNDRSLWAAAAFLYLNVLCFNGVWRQNRKGEFNVPFGSRSERNLPSRDALASYAAQLKAFWRSPALGATWWRIEALPFDQSIRLVPAGAAIYADPPYWETFAGYNKAPFGPMQQGMLANELRAAHRRGVAVFATNSDVPEIRTLYSWAKIEVLKEPRRVAANGDRKAAGCVLIIAD